MNRASNGFDLGGGQLANFFFQPLPTASLPASPTVGTGKYDTTLNSFVVWNGTAWIATDVSKVAVGFIPISKLAVNPLDRAQHTGSQTASTISDFALSVQAIKWNTLATPTTSIVGGSQEYTNMGNATADTSGINLGQAKSLLYGKLYRRVTTVAAIANVNIAAPGATFDGVILTNAGIDSVFLGPAQTNGQDRGPYIWNGAAAPLTRMLDADASAEVQPGLEVFISKGATLDNHTFRLDTDGPIVFGTTSLTFTDEGQSSTYTGSTSINITGNTISTIVKPAGGILSGASGLEIDTALIVRKAEFQIIGDGATTQFVLTHTLNTRNVTASMRENATPYNEWTPDNQATTTNTITIFFAVAPAVGVKYDLVVRN